MKEFTIRQILLASLCCVDKEVKTPSAKHHVDGMIKMVNDSLLAKTTKSEIKELLESDDSFIKDKYGAGNYYYMEDYDLIHKDPEMVFLKHLIELQRAQAALLKCSKGTLDELIIICDTAMNTVKIVQKQLELMK